MLPASGKRWISGGGMARIGLIGPIRPIGPMGVKASSQLEVRMRGGLKSGLHYHPFALPWAAGVGALQVGDGDGEGVGGVVGGGFGEFEEGADHEGDLGFVSRSATDDGL